MSNDFEFAHSKMNVRMDLMQQIIQFANWFWREDLYFATLPGIYWTFETMLSHRLKELGFDPEFNCAEFKYPEYLKAKNNMPTNVIGKYIHGTIEHLVEHNDCDVVWGDYCGLATTHRIKSMVKCFVKTDNEASLVYCTVYANPRKYAKNPKKILKNSKTKDYDTAVMEEFDYWFRHYKIKSKVKLVYKNVYSNGQGNRMMTIGFAFNDVPIDPIIHKAKPKVTQNKSEYSDIAKETWDRIAAEQGITKKKATKSQKSDINALVAEELDISRSKVGSIMAHYLNPESFPKAA